MESVLELRTSINAIEKVAESAIAESNGLPRLGRIRTGAIAWSDAQESRSEGEYSMSLTCRAWLMEMNGSEVNRSRRMIEPREHLIDDVFEGTFALQRLIRGNVDRILWPADHTRASILSLCVDRPNGLEWPPVARHIRRISKRSIRCRIVHFIGDESMSFFVESRN